MCRPGKVGRYKGFSCVSLFSSCNEEPVLVQAFVAELAIEALDVRVLDRLAGTDEAQTHAHLIGPGIEHLAFELRPMLHGDRQRQASRRSPHLVLSARADCTE